MESENLVITKDLAIIGTLTLSNKTDKLNACLQLARWYIYCEKLKLETTRLYRFLCLLKYKIKLEKMICQGNHQNALYERMWLGIEEHIN
jgi:hypothetical protein